MGAHDNPTPNGRIPFEELSIDGVNIHWGETT